jgi:lipopolysaccharide/colanic/teichoic acid biosynthesis glycosyltransferase
MNPRMSGALYLVKYVLEWSLACIILVFSLPIAGVASIAVLIESGRPIFFTQTRVGKHGRQFRLFKFRTMRQNSLSIAEVGQVTSSHPLVTRLGRILRRYKIDEIPQLCNVLRGEMLLVGPRPTVIEQVERYDSFQRRRLLVMPGLTGWAQVNGNTSLTWEDRIRLDVWYIDHWSPVLDAAILAKTIVVALRGEHLNNRAIEEARSHENSINRRGKIDSNGAGGARDGRLRSPGDDNDRSD